MRDSIQPPTGNDIPTTNVVDLRRRVVATPAKRSLLSRLRQRQSAASPVRPEPTLVAAPPVAATETPKRTPIRSTWRWPVSWRVSSFPILALLLLVPFIAVSLFQPVRAWAERVEQPSEAGVAAFKSALTALQEFDLDQATTDFTTAETAFAQAHVEYESLGGFGRSVLSIVPGVRSRYRDGDRLLQAGEQIARAGQRLSQALKPLRVANPASATFAGPQFLASADDIGTSLTDLRQALQTLSEVQPDNVPGTYRKHFATLLRLAPEVDNRLAILGEAIPYLTQLLGANNQEQEYLFLFQNNAELRPGGGFIGSLALVKFLDGKYTILDAPGRGPFAINDFFPKVLVPPQPVSVIAPYWALHDANWFVDFPTSAKKVAWFYEQARGFPIDGVIALTPTVVERLLRVTGPLSLPAYDTVVTADTFTRVTQDIVEHRYDKAVNAPKQFVIDLIPALLEKLAKVPPSDMLALLLAVDDSITKKDLLVWNVNEEQQARAQRLGWTGELPTTSDDFLAVVEANLGGGKTSQVLKRQAELAIQTTSEGLDHTLTMTFRHEGTLGDVFTGPRYRGYLKFYVPAGSELLDANGFDAIPTADFKPAPAEAEPDADLRSIESRPVLDEQSSLRQTDEFGRRAFGGWLILPTGESQTVTLRYRSPLPKTESETGVTLSLQIAKQPGAVSFPLSVKLSGPGKLKYSSNDSSVKDGLVSTLLTVDRPVSWSTVWTGPLVAP